MEIEDDFEKAVIFKLRELRRVGFGSIDIRYHNGEPSKIFQNIPNTPGDLKKYVRKVEAAGTLSS